MRSIQSQLRRANPVPVSGAHVDRATYDSILDKVVELEGQPSLPRVPPQWQAMRFAAAALVLVIAVGAGYLWGASRATIKVSAGSSPTELALLYIDARNNADLSDAQAILGPDAVLVEYPVIRNAAELKDVFDYLQVVDERLVVLGCASPAERPDVVRCDYQMDDRLVAKTGAEPIPGVMSFVIADGRVVAVENAIDIEAYTITALDPWFVWLDQNVDGGTTVLYRRVFQLDRSVPTPRSDRLEDLADALEIYTPHT